MSSRKISLRCLSENKMMCILISSTIITTLTLVCTFTTVRNKVKANGLSENRQINVKKANDKDKDISLIEQYLRDIYKEEQVHIDRSIGIDAKVSDTLSYVENGFYLIELCAYNNNDNVEIHVNKLWKTYDNITKNADNVQLYYEEEQLSKLTSLVVKLVEMNEAGMHINDNNITDISNKICSRYVSLKRRNMLNDKYSQLEENDLRETIYDNGSMKVEIYNEKNENIICISSKGGDSNIGS